VTREWVRRRDRPLSPGEAARLRDDAVRALSTRLAHQLGNLLQVVNGNLELIARRTDDATTLRYLGHARAAAEQLTQLARSLPGEPPG
jgi:two-component sensor histidine kinase